MGICNSALSKKLQLDAALTLESAVTQVHQAEALQLQQLLLTASYIGGKPEIPVCTVKKGSDTPHQNCKGTQHRPGHRQIVNSTRGYTWCGKFPLNDRDHCPARDSKCQKCNKCGYFQVVCRTTKVGAIQGNPDRSESPNDVFNGGLQIKCLSRRTLTRGM